jgi:cyclopropane-fatty-acyl-phospholipid synthase
MKDILHNLFSQISADLKDESFAVEFWDKTVKTYGSGSRSFKVIIKTPQAARRILTEKTLGFGEEYAEGHIVVEGDLQSFIKLGSSKAYKELKPSLYTIAKIIFYHLSSLNSINKSKSNIAAHYDKGVDFYSLWLDKSLTYSCAYFKNKNDTLEQAQQNKYEHICRKLMLKKGERLVDIGCGFGGMLIYTCKNYDVEGVGYTLSEDQHSEAVKRILNEGLEDKIKIYLKDYRKASGKFDKFVSIGMFEHVGRKYYKDFFQKVRSLLIEGGLGVLHTIGHNIDEPTDPWIRKHIFPGAEVPAIQNIIDSIGKDNLHFIDIENLRYHYYKTLQEWIDRFENNIDEIRKMYDEKFIRMWRLYLNGSSTAFYQGGLALYQITFTHGINNSLPITREHIYS